MGRNARAFNDWVDDQDVSIYEPGSKDDIDIDYKYLEEKVSVFFHNDPQIYCKTVPAKTPDDYEEPSFLKTGGWDTFLLNWEDPETYREETTSYMQQIADLDKNPEKKIFKK